MPGVHRDHERTVAYSSPVVVLPRQSLLRLLLVAVALLAVGFAVTHFLKLQGFSGQMGFRRLFNMEDEANLPSWFSSGLMLACSAALAMVAAIKFGRCEAFRWHWGGLAVGFLAMSADEGAQLHEMLNRAAKSLPLKNEGLLYYPWVVFGLVIVAAIGIFYLKFLAHLPRQIRWRFIVAGALFVLGAIGVEMLAGAVADSQGLDVVPDFQLTGDFTTEYMLLIALEESLELLGIIVFLDALLRYIGNQYGQVSIEVSNR